MSVFSGRSGLVSLLAALCLTGATAHAQVAPVTVAPVTYWTPGWPLGFSDNLTAGQDANTYGDFPDFVGSTAASGGFSYVRHHFPNGWFVGGERGIGLGVSGIDRAAAFGNFGSLYTEGVQFGYRFKSANGMPLTVYAGFDTLKYDSGIGSPFGAMSGTLPGYSAHAGIEFQPAPNLSLSLGVGFSQQPGRIGSDINSSLLPGASPFAFGGRP